MSRVNNNLSYFYRKQRFLVRISVIIVTYNAQYFLKYCIDSLLKSKGLPGFEILVVDNNSEDDSCEMLRKYFPEVILIENTTNEGFSRANNKAVSKAKGDYILILNPDMIVAEDTISKVFEYGKITDRLGAIGVQFMDGSGSFLPECKRNFPTPKVAGLKFLGYSKKYYADGISREATAEVDVLTGAFMLMKKEVYNEVGGFDEDFFMYGEDIDLSYRMTKAGYRNFYFGGEKVIHFKGESTLKNKAYFQNFYGAMAIFYKKHFKTNVILTALIDGIVKGTILIRSNSNRSNSNRKTEKQEDKGIEWVYLGRSEATYMKLKMKFPGTNGSMVSSFSIGPIATDVLFIDSAAFSFTEIISCIYRQKSIGTTNRIISENGAFYIGSDTSDDRGEVVLL